MVLSGVALANVDCANKWNFPWEGFFHFRDLPLCAAGWVEINWIIFPIFLIQSILLVLKIKPSKHCLQLVVSSRFFINSSQTRGSSSFVKSRNSGLKFDPNYILPGRGRETPQKWQSQLKPRFFLKWRENLTPTAMHLGVFVKFSQTHKKKRAPHKRMRFCSFFSVPRKIPARFLPFCGSQFRSIWMCIIKNPFAPESSQRQRVTVCYGRMWVSEWVCVCASCLEGTRYVIRFSKKKLNNQKGSEPSWWWGWHMCKLWRIFCLPASYTCVGFVNGSVGIYSFGKKNAGKINIVETFVEMPF